MVDALARTFGYWQPLSLLGEGGQGSVYRALNTRRVNLVTAAQGLAQGVERARGLGGADKGTAALIADSLRVFRAADDPINHGALKLLRTPDEKARRRLDAEARAYQAVKHPHLVRLLDYNEKEGWLVTALQTGGTLEEHRGVYQRDPGGALSALRPVIEAVGALHEAGIIHRDIKPANIFLGANGDLVLGDAGIVYFADDSRTRTTDTLENVGSRDWMPGWATGMRVEDIRPTFDLFSLGKVLWSLVSGQPLLRFWYHRRSEFNLEHKFPGDSRMAPLNALLDQIIVEFEEDMALTTASALLGAVDNALSALTQPQDPADTISRGVPTKTSPILTAVDGAIGALTQPPPPERAASRDLPAGTPPPIGPSSVGKPRDHLRVEDVTDNGPPDRNSDVLVRGRVFNDSTALTLRAVQVAIDALDEAGSKLGSRDTFTTPTDIGPEEAGTFRTYVRVSRPRDYSRCVARVISAHGE